MKNRLKNLGKKTDKDRSTPATTNLNDDISEQTNTNSQMKRATP